MKRSISVTGSILSLLVLGALVVALILTFGRLLRSAEPSSQAFQSPIETPMPPRATPTPWRATPTPPRGTPTTLPPMAAKATAVARGAQYTPRPRPLYPIHSPQDVVNIVLNDPEFQASLNDPIFGPHSKGATHGEPIFVKSISPNRPDYYIVPFYKNGRVTGLAVVNIQEDKGEVGMWANADDPRFPPVDAAEARRLVENRGYTVMGEPGLVFRMLIENMDKTLPFWEVKTTEGTVFYVIHVLGTTKVYRADEVHPID